MAVITGNDGALTVGSRTVAALRNFSVEVTTDTIETSSMGQSYRTYTNGMSSWTGSADIYFESADGTFFNLTTGTIGSTIATPVTAKFYIDQDATNDVAYTGTCIVTGFTVNSSMDGLVEASISLQGAGALNFSSTGNA